MAQLPTSSEVVTILRCIECGAVDIHKTNNFRCDACGDLLEIAPARSTQDAERLKSLWLSRRTSFTRGDQSGVWRFRELLPAVDEKHVITLREGNTPLYDLPKCARAIRVDRLLAKHQGMNPTGSFKDTGMTVAASAAKHAGFRWVACASTGNTSASVAAYAAHGGMRSLVLVPSGKVTWGKLSQALDYGALTCELRTDFDGCVRVLNEVIEKAQVYLLNSVNPWRIEGQKTAAIELMEQLQWNPPDHVIVPGGNLGNSSAIGKAFLEMREVGLIAAVPRISVIQAEGANAFVRTVREEGGKKLVPVKAETMASAIRIGNPASWKKAVRVVQATLGTVEEVSEIEIAIAKAEIGAEGIGCEPASAVTLAGLKKLTRSGFVKRNETVVLILTGHLLKDPEYTLKFHRGDGFGEEDAVRQQQRRPVEMEANASEVIDLLRRADDSGSRGFA